MQFYLTVPILFFALEYVDKVRPVFKYFLISIIPLSSFIYQTFSTGDSSHMLLIARFWQFFAGFFAYYSFENYWLNFVKNENTETSRKQILDEIVSLAACALLCLLFLVWLQHSHSTESFTRHFTCSFNRWKRQRKLSNLK
ncbi:hypothetical protein M3Y97_00705300 [Aphelenchoides bicaudatus]|nr:hypothetical protein M3Y97_00705300 [Aphelenchoides bicaudatus]